ncbi:MAG: DUF4249 domain-containing protein, partial [Bacteroidales bacterium]|nr:DUF4249 domain-containing protein [Bacteroidales bacterium]
MKRLTHILFAFLLSAITGCTMEFDPDPEVTGETLVVEGMITDQDRVNRIRLARSQPIGEILNKKVAVTGAVVTITDDDGTVSTLTESPPGTYCTDSVLFRGRVGASYSLRVILGGREYETDFMEMKPVPPI